MLFNEKGAYKSTNVSHSPLAFSLNHGGWNEMQARMAREEKKMGREREN